MFKKLLLKSLKKRFQKFSPEEKQFVREMVNDKTISVTTENKQKEKVKKRRTKKMADVEEVKKDEVTTENVETENKEVDKDKSTETVEEGDKKVETTDKKEEETKEEPTEAEETKEPTDPQVNETEPTGNGIRIEDLVTKEMLAERLSALEAKFDAVVKENKDLKDELSNKSDELKGMQDKYENKNFGGFQKQGVMAKNQAANDSFDSYSKQFM